MCLFGLFEFLLVLFCLCRCLDCVLVGVCVCVLFV